MYSFSYLEPVCCSMSSCNCCFLTCIQISQEADQVVWYSHLFQNFPQFIVIHEGNISCKDGLDKGQKWYGPNIKTLKWEHIQSLTNKKEMSIWKGRSVLGAEVTEAAGDHITQRFIDCALIPNRWKRVKVKGAHSCPTLCDPMNYTVHGILQASILA